MPLGAEECFRDRAVNQYMCTARHSLGTRERTSCERLVSQQVPVAMPITPMEVSAHSQLALPGATADTGFLHHRKRSNGL